MPSQPNTDKLPNTFVGSLSYEQLRCSGVFEAVTIRRQGYPARMGHAAFFKRFKSLASLSTDQSTLRALAMVQASASEESEASDPTASSSLVPKDPKMACKVLIDVLAQQPALSRLTVECQIGKTMVLWRTDVNKAITLVRAVCMGVCG